MGEHTPETIEKRFAELAELKDGWLDGDGLSVPPHAIVRARNFIRVSKTSGFSIFPLEEGGIGLEWVGDGPNDFLSVEFIGASGEDREDTVWSLSGDPELKPHPRVASTGDES